MFGQQGHVAGVGAPHHVLDLGDLDGGERALLLHVEERDTVGVPQQQGARAGVEDLLTAGHLHLLHNLVLQVLDEQLNRERDMGRERYEMDENTFAGLWGIFTTFFLGSAGSGKPSAADLGDLGRRAEFQKPGALTECMRSRTAKRFLATQTAVRPDDLFPSGAVGRYGVQHGRKHD